MKTLKRILLVVLLIVGVALLIPVFVNGDISVEREITVARPKAMVFEFLSLTKNEEQFAVWTEADPNTKKTYTGVDGTVGSVYSWDSANDDVGKGEQEIKAIVEGDSICYELRFERPFTATHRAWFFTESAGENSTKVKWGFQGKMGYPAKGILLFMDMKGELGSKLQRGLDNLKVVMEKMPLPMAPVPTDTTASDTIHP